MIQGEGYPLRKDFHYCTLDISISTRFGGWIRACELITPLALTLTHPRLSSEVANTYAQWISSKLGKGARPCSECILENNVLQKATSEDEMEAAATPRSHSPARVLGQDEAATRHVKLPKASKG